MDISDKSKGVVGIGQKLVWVIVYVPFSCLYEPVMYQTQFTFCEFLWAVETHVALSMVLNSFYVLLRLRDLPLLL